jgi:hypothetical protein
MCLPDTRSLSGLVAAGAMALSACSESLPEAGDERVHQGAFSLTSTSTFVSVYQDAMAEGWSNWSWATNTLSNSSPTSSGVASIKATYGAWTGLYFTSTGLSANGLDFVDLKVRSDGYADHPIYARLGLGDAFGPPVLLGPHCQGNSIPVHSFARCQVPLSALGANGDSSITGLILQEGSGSDYVVMFYDEIGFSAASPLPADAPPAAPAGLSATASPGSVVLSWLPVADASSYSVFRGALPAGPYAALSVAQLTTSFTDPAIASGSTWWYTVAALNEAGSSPLATPVSATMPPPLPVQGSFWFEEPFAWSGDHAVTMATSGTTTRWNIDMWDVRGDTSYNAASYLMTQVQQEKGFHADVHKAASADMTSGAVNDAVHVAGGDGSRGLGTMHLDFEGIVSARLRNPLLIASEERPGIVRFRQTRFVTTGHWWEVAITPASRVTAGEWTSVPALNAGLAGPFGTGLAINTTLGVGNGHTPPEDSVNFIFQGYPDIPAMYGWHVRPEVKATIAGTQTNVWVPVAGFSELPPTDPAEIDHLYSYRLEYRPSGIDFYADWDAPGVLTLRGHYPISIPWPEVYVHLLGVAYQADQHPQAPCYQGQTRELRWADFLAAPVKYYRTSLSPGNHQHVIGDTDTIYAWVSYDLRDIQNWGGPTFDGLLRPNGAPYDRYGSMAYTSFKVWAGKDPPQPRKSVELWFNVTAEQASAAAARFLYDIRYTGTATLSINGTVVGLLPAATTVPAALVESPDLSSVWVERDLPFNPALLRAGGNTLRLVFSGQVNLDRLQFEFSHKQWQ